MNAVSTLALLLLNPKSKAMPLIHSKSNKQDHYKIGKHAISDCDDAC